MHNIDIKQFKAQQKYDLIICNPPFFSDHLKGQDRQRNQARHNDGLSFKALNESIIQHLSENGKAWILLPCSEFDNFMGCAQQAKLQLHRKWLLSSRVHKAPHRVIFSLAHCSQPVIPAQDKHLVVHAEQGREYSEEFKSLLCDYYLNL